MLNGMRRSSKSRIWALNGIMVVEASELESPKSDGALGNDRTPNLFNKQRKPIFESDLSKYFLHGLAFSLLMLVIVLGWAFLLVLLVRLGSIIGLIIGIVALVYAVGALNVWINNIVWGGDISEDWKKILFHGLFLFIALILVGIPGMVINQLVPGIATNIVIFAVYCFVDGYVARRLAFSM